jgi:hypothetical protein
MGCEKNPNINLYRKNHFPVNGHFPVEQGDFVLSQKNNFIN